MGTDIFGGVEIRPDGEGTAWVFSGVRLGDGFGRDYALFGALFGVRKDTGLAPPAFKRYLPRDTSRELVDEFAKFGPRYRNQRNYPTWIAWSEIWSIYRDPAVRGILEANAGWQALMGRLLDLAAEHGEENVRLVVWFD